MSSVRRAAYKTMSNFLQEVNQIAPDFEAWVEAEILKLSVDTLKSRTWTCTACPEIQGDYIIKHEKQTIRCLAPEAYALLQFFAQQEVSETP